MCENVDKKNVLISPQDFEHTTREFYSHGDKRLTSARKFHCVDHYCVIKDFPYQLDMDFQGSLLEEVDNGRLLNEERYKITKHITNM